MYSKTRIELRQISTTRSVTISLTTWLIIIYIIVPFFDEELDVLCRLAGFALVMI